MGEMVVAMAGTHKRDNRTTTQEMVVAMVGTHNRDNRPTTQEMVVVIVGTHNRDNRPTTQEMVVAMVDRDNRPTTQEMVVAMVVVMVGTHNSPTTTRHQPTAWAATLVSKLSTTTGVNKFDSKLLKNI